MNTLNFNTPVLNENGDLKPLVEYAGGGGGATPEALAEVIEGVSPISVALSESGDKLQIGSEGGSVKYHNITLLPSGTGNYNISFLLPSEKTVAYSNIQELSTDLWTLGFRDGNRSLSASGYCNISSQLRDVYGVYGAINGVFYIKHATDGGFSTDNLGTPAIIDIII